MVSKLQPILILVMVLERNSVQTPIIASRVYSPKQFDGAVAPGLADGKSRTGTCTIA